MDRQRPAAFLHLALIAAVLVACSSRSSVPQGLGVKRAVGAARNLLVTADGSWLAFLDGCVETRAQSLPAGTANCDLRAVPAGGGEAILVARAVTTLPGAVAVSPKGADLAALSGYDYANAAGTLVRWTPGGAARELAGGVTFHGYGPDGTLGYIAGGALHLAQPGGEPQPVPGVAAAASFDLAPPGTGLAGLVRRRATAGGELLALAPPKDGTYSSPQPLDGPVGDYRFGEKYYAYTRLARGKEPTELRVAEARPGARAVMAGFDVRAFSFAPRGDAIAFLADATPGKEGNLRVRAGTAEATLGREVGAFRWADRAPLLAWLEEYDTRVRSGTLGVGGPSQARRTFGKNVSDMELSADGKHVAYLQHSTRGGYTVDLLLAAVDGPAGALPRRISQASYGFGFSPEGKWLYYRTRCTRNGEGCDLERIATASADGKPELIAEGMKSFEFDPRDPGRLLVSWKRLDRDALDLAVWDGARLVTVDTYALPGSARFLPGTASRVGYVVVHEKRFGVYVAELPAAK